ncbi:MAG TPA: hypothetical protein VIC05_09275 [Solirubrobacteraceae bacterium]|jgi:hypothetical protein
MLKRLRVRLPLSLLATALLSALGGGLTAVLPGSALTSARPDASVAAKHNKPSKHAKKTSGHHRVSVRRGPPGPVGPAGPAGPQGPAGATGAPGPQIAVSLQVDWREASNIQGHESASVALPGIGTLSASCTLQAQTLTLTPASSTNRTVLDASTLQGEGNQGVSSNERRETTGEPTTLALPPNGMITATVSLEPIAGNGGEQLSSPAMLTLSSEYEQNGSSGSEDYCYIAGQIIQQQ